MSTSFHPRKALAVLLSALALATAGTLHAQGYPSKPVRIVVAYPPGGPVDAVARLIEAPLSRALGQPIIIENKAGAGGVIGSDFVAKAPPDGYVLLLGSTPLAIQDTLLPKLPYVALRDFTAVANIAEGPQVLVVGMQVPVRNVRELIDYAKANGNLSYASPSTGGSNHLAAEMFKGAAGFKATHIPYKGNAPAEVDLIAGRVTFMFGALGSSLRHVESGRLRALGVTTKKRFPAYPDLPTIGETLPGFEVTSWYGLLGPKDMPADVVNKLNAEVNRIITDPDFRKRLTSQDLEPMPGSGPDFANYLKRNTEMWRKVIKDNNVTAE